MSKLNTKFLLQTGTKVWLAYLLIYSFILLQFWWGNHDWDRLKNGINISDGFFEARYSQHLFSAVLFDGQLLPIITPLIAILALTFSSLLAARYLNLPQKEKSYILLSVLISASPYTLILFYYSFITLPLTLWSFIGITLLFSESHHFNIKRFVIQILGYSLLLGSYPPILSLILTLYGAKKITEYTEQNIPLTTLIKNTLLFISQLTFAYLIFLLIIKQLPQYSYSIEQMYNTQTANFLTILTNIPKELLKSLMLFNTFNSTLGSTYSIFYTILITSSFVIIIYSSSHKLLTSIMLLLLLLVSRFVFIITPNAYMAEFRITFWGHLGLIFFATSTLLKNNTPIIKNFTFAFIICFILIFTKTNIAIQKAQFLSFKSERLYHARLYNTLTSHPHFNYNNKYFSLNIGYPNFRHRFHNKNIFNNELFSNTVLPFDLTEKLFWEEDQSPVICKKGIWNNALWTVQDTKHLNCSNPHPNKNIRYWLYTKAKPYPHKNSIYIDNHNIILLLDAKQLHKSKELVAKNLSN